MVRNTLTRLVLLVVLALASAAFAQVINYPLPQTHSSVNYGRAGGVGTFLVPWESQGAIVVNINGAQYNFKFNFDVVGNQIVPTESKVEFCQTMNVSVCSSGAPTGTFVPFAPGKYWGTFPSVAFDCEGTAGSFKSSASYFDFGYQGRISYALLEPDSILELE